VALRSYAYSTKESAWAAPGLALWEPALRLKGGEALVTFTLPPSPGPYRVLLYGHTPDGRLGFSQGRLEAAGK
jgi:hypothetical protein